MFYSITRLSVLSYSTIMAKSSSDDKPAPSWLDRDLIVRALKSDDPTIDESSVKLISVETVGGGYLSETLRVVAQSTSGGGDAREASLIVKAAPDTTGALKDMMLSGVHDKEAITYSLLLPSLYSALKKAEGSNWRPLAPRMYLQVSEPVEAMVLEDMAAEGFRAWPQADGLDLDHCSVAIRAIARMHAASVGLISQERYAGQAFQQSILFNEFALKNLDADEAAFKENLQILNENPWFHKFTDKLRTNARLLLQTPILRVQHYTVDFKVMVHGDLHKDNMMFRDNEDGLQVRLYDFQGVHVGSPAEDLHYFLYSSASLEVLRDHTEQLLREYHSSLQQTLRALGLRQQADDYPLEQFHRDMDHFRTVAVVTIFKILPYRIPIEEIGPPPDKHSENLKEEFDKYRLKCYKNDKFLRYLECLVPLFDAKGYFDSQSM